jgi:serine/threonine protein kinase
MGHHHLHDPNKVKPVIMAKTVSFVCRDFLKQCLYQNPEDRWTAAELLHHPFIADRNKANKLPYQRKVAEEILANLLQPPRRLDPELPDEPITQRVDRHINGTNPSWPTRLAGCGSQRVVPPLPRANIAGSSKPLPPVSPGHKEDDFPFNYLGWIPKHNPPAGDPKSPRCLSPQNSEKLIVPTPVGSPEYVAADSTKIREAYDHMINSANAMREANEDILQSARAGSKEQDRSICEELFPQLGNSSPSPDRNGKTPMEEIYGTLYSVPL